MNDFKGTALRNDKKERLFFNLRWVSRSNWSAALSEPEEEDVHNTCDLKVLQADNNGPEGDGALRDEDIQATARCIKSLGRMTIDQ